MGRDKPDRSRAPWSRAGSTASPSRHRSARRYLQQVGEDRVRDPHRPVGDSGGRYDAATVMRLSRRETTELATGLAYLAPSLVLFAAFVFIPLGRTVYLSFFNTRATGTTTTFAGLDHYLELFASPTFHTGLLATAIFALYTVPIGIALGLVLAVALNQRLRGINVFRTMMASTIAISAAVGALIWLLLFNPSLGLLNYVLSRVGIHGPEWLIQPTTAIIAVSITTIWLTLGTNIIVLLAGLQGVPEEIYEAARLDGARGLRMFTRITIPMVSPSLFFLLVVDTIGVLQASTQIHLQHADRVDHEKEEQRRR